MLKKFKAMLLMLALIPAIAVSVHASGLDNESQAETYHTSLLHEGDFPEKKTFSRNLLKEGDIIKEALFLKDESLEITTDISVEELVDLYETVINSEPELYYVESDVKISADGEKCIIYPQYEEEISLFSFDSGKEFQEEVERILATVTDDMTDIEKAMAVHDYMARFYEYDYTLQKSDIKDIFLEKQGVCQAYSDAYTYIMQKKLGIDCYTLSSPALYHAWNVIKIDGEWYHVDITWDDPKFNGKDYFGATRHANFLVSSGTIRDSEHGHNTYDWEVSAYSVWKYGFDAPNRIEEPTSERFDDYIWSKTGFSPFIYHNGTWYYILEGELYKYDFKTNKSEQVMKLRRGTIYDTFDIYENTAIYKYYWEDGVKMFPLNGSGSRALKELDDAYAFRTNGDMLEYVEYDIFNFPTFYNVKLSDIVFTIPMPDVSVQDGKDVTVTLSDKIGGIKYYYTTDGNEPTKKSSYGTKIKVGKKEKVQIRLLAVKDGYNNGEYSIFIKDGKVVTAEEYEEEPQDKPINITSVPLSGGGEPITSKSISNLASVKFNIGKISNEPKNITVMVGFYDANGKMLGIGTKEVTLTEDITPVEVPVEDTLSGSSEFDIFIWGEMNALNPIAKRETFLIQ